MPAQHHHRHAALHQRQVSSNHHPNGRSANPNDSIDEPTPPQLDNQYRGWSTSIAAVLDDPQRRNGTCALVCCGLLLSDRTRYILTHEIPNWQYRRRLNLYLPLGLYVGLLICDVLALADCADANSLNNCQPDPILTGMAGLFKWTLLVVLVVLLVRGSKKRAELRVLVWNHVRNSVNDSIDINSDNGNNTANTETTTSTTTTTTAESSSSSMEASSEAFANEPSPEDDSNPSSNNSSSNNNNNNANTFEFQSQIRDATGCCRCYRRDDEWEAVAEAEAERISQQSSSLSSSAAEQTYQLSTISNGDDDDPMMTTPVSQPDLARCLFRGFSRCCCASCCNAWWQCLGMCAIAQEDRELERFLQRQQQQQSPTTTNSQLPVLPALQMDFVSFERWDDYYPKIEQLQRTQNRSIIEHGKALSRLSQRILWRYYVLIVALQAFLYGAVSQSLAHVVILLGVHAQGLLLLYLVYWRWHCLDLSLDAVIKFVASGAVLGFSTGLIIEGIEMVVMGIVFYIALIFQASEEAQDQGTTIDQLFDKQHAAETFQEIVKDHLGFYAAFMFIFAFFTAALTEEICKYFSYWMVETPDEQHDKTNHRRRAAQITIGMIAASIGFATRENVSYVMGQQSTSDEIWVLVLRSLLPIHPICAALQSIGIVRRDIEEDSRFQLGRSLLPAILLHGLYDFSIFLDGLVEFTEEDPVDLDSGGADTDENQLTFSNVSPQLLMGLVFVAAGLGYYFVEARNQRHRLEAMVAAAASVDDEEIQLQDLPQQHDVNGIAPEPNDFTIT